MTDQTPIEKIGQKAGKMFREAFPQPDLGDAPKGIKPEPLKPEERLEKMSNYVRAPRKTPVGTYTRKVNGEEAIVYVRVLNRLGWWLVPLIGSLFTLLAAWPIGMYFAAEIAPWQRMAQYMLWGAIIGAALSAGATLWLTLAQRFWMEIVIQEERVKINGTTYDRNLTSGFRMGYTIESDSNALKQSFQDMSMGFTGLRFSYGPWGEDLPYVMNKYHGAEIVIWLNELMAGVGAREPGNNEPQTGHRAEIF